MGKLRICLLFCVAALVLDVAPAAWGQGVTGANTEIMDLVRSGAPASTVVSSIRKGSGHWDTSQGALIAFRGAGATLVEVNALMQSSTEEAVQAAAAQASNLEILDMVQSGAPESVVLSNIRKGSGHWDTSQGALIAFREAGATLVEVNALMQTHSAQAPATQVSNDELKAMVRSGFSESNVLNVIRKGSGHWDTSVGALVAFKGAGATQEELSALMATSPVPIRDHLEAPNEELLKMVVAGLPEEVVLYKIRQGAGRWDTSADSLSALKASGATAAEVNAVRQTDPVVAQAMKEEAERQQASAQEEEEQNSGEVFVDNREPGRSEPSSSSSGGGFLDALTNALGVINNGLDAQIAQGNARNAELQQRMDDQIAANNARRERVAEQQREQAERQTQLAEQRRQERQRQAVAQSAASFAPSTGTAAPPTVVCPDVTKPCTPLSQYHPAPAQTQPVAGAIKPVSGCLYDANVPPPTTGPCALMASNAGPSGGGVMGGGGGSSGENGGGGSASAGYDDPLNCIVASYRNDPITGDHLILTNNCGQSAHVYWYASPQITGGTELAVGGMENTYASHDGIVAAGGVTLYACPSGGTPVDANGSFAAVTTSGYFHCKRP